MAKKPRKKAQWHPLFAELLRPLLQDYFDVQTNVPVGDVPREADILLVRRTTDKPTPFRGLWRHLTTWNIVEFKGPTVDARLHDLSRLVETGLGIDRRMNQERRRERISVLEPAQVSFWYIVRRIGGRFLKEARLRLGQLEEIESGLWRSQVLGHMIFLVSSETFVSEPDCVPLHLLLRRSPPQERELAQLVMEQPHFLEWYGRWLGTLHPDAWTEVRNMAMSRRRGPELDFSAMKNDMNDRQVVQAVESLGLERVLKAFGPKKLLEAGGLDWFLANLSPADLKRLKARLK